ncbi:hypothetical protein, partial [Streptomyces sp. NPDC127119]|uniref:hypothetical protein n=1 Tax=Streptomyces sp. NPDC127119 TaxID=3345370 RepID=UPI00363B1FA2
FRGAGNCAASHGHPSPVHAPQPPPPQGREEPRRQPQVTGSWQRASAPPPQGRGELRSRFLSV